MQQAVPGNQEGSKKRPAVTPLPTTWPNPETWNRLSTRSGKTANGACRISRTTSTSKQRAPTGGLVIGKQGQEPAGISKPVDDPRKAARLSSMRRSKLRSVEQKVLTAGRRPAMPSVLRSGAGTSTRRNTNRRSQKHKLDQLKRELTSRTGNREPAYTGQLSTKMHIEALELCGCTSSMVSDLDNISRLAGLDPKSIQNRNNAMM